MLVRRLPPRSFLDLRERFEGGPLELACMANLRVFCMIRRHSPGLCTLAINTLEGLSP
jgi:hypothetical protein